MLPAAPDDEPLLGASNEDPVDEDAVAPGEGIRKLVFILGRLSGSGTRGPLMGKKRGIDARRKEGAEEASFAAESLPSHDDSSNAHAILLSAAETKAPAAADPNDSMALALLVACERFPAACSRPFFARARNPGMTHWRESEPFALHARHKLERANVACQAGTACW